MLEIAFWQFFLKKYSKDAYYYRKVLNRNILLNNGQNAELYIIWWGQIGQVLTIYKEDIREKLNCVIIET